MQEKYSKKIEINKVGIVFTNKEMTAYGRFSLLAAFFEREGTDFLILKRFKEVEQMYCGYLPILRK